MKRMVTLAVVLSLALSLARLQASDKQGGETSLIGKNFSAFAGLTVTDAKGKPHKLSELKTTDQALVIAFVSNKCPWSMGRCERLQAMADGYAAKGVKLVGISANKGEKLDGVIEKLGKRGVKFPIYRDKDKSVTSALEAMATPHMFIFDKKGVLRYSGAFDDSMSPDNVKRKFCEDALAAVLAGKEIADPAPKFIIGCSIK